MGKRRRRSREYAPSISNAPRSALRESLLRRNAYPSLRLLEDRRLFTPEIFPIVKAIKRSQARMEVNARKADAARPFAARHLTAPANLRFADPRGVAICIRRHQRREVLHALKRTGRGSSRKLGRWNEHSHVSCKK